MSSNSQVFYNFFRTKISFINLTAIDFLSPSYCFIFGSPDSAFVFTLWEAERFGHLRGHFYYKIHVHVFFFFIEYIVWTPAANFNIEAKMMNESATLGRISNSTFSNSFDDLHLLSWDVFFARALTYLNPWGLSALHWIVGFILIRGAIAFYDNLVEFLVVYSKVAKLPTREDPVTGATKEVRYVGLNAISLIYLIVNAADEWIFVQNLTHFIWHSEDVPKALNSLQPLNTLAALYLMFLVLDFFYAPAHRFLHWRPVYPYIHKHHHRQIFPVRGYLDAGNEHPIEHIIGVACTWMAVWCAVRVTGAHAVTIFFFFNIHAALAMLNHSPYDVDVTILGLNYSVKAHEMHHRKFTTNYAQYWMGMDKLMGTFVEYRDEGGNVMPAPKGKLL